MHSGAHIISTARFRAGDRLYRVGVRTGRGVDSIDRVPYTEHHGDRQEVGGAAAPDMGDHGGTAHEQRASLLHATEPNPCRVRVRRVRRRFVRGVLRGAAGPSEPAAGAVIPVAMGYFEGLSSARICVAGVGFAEPAVVSGVGGDRGGTEPFDVVADAPADRQGDARGGVHARLERVAEADLVRWKTVAVDTTTLVANATMPNIERRDTAESLEAFARRLPEASGIATRTRAELRRFHRFRKSKTTSTKEWHSSQDPDAKMAAEPVEPGHPDGAGVEEDIAATGYHSDNTLGRRRWHDNTTGETPPAERSAQKALHRTRRRLPADRRFPSCRRELLERPLAHQYEAGGLRLVPVRVRENGRKRVLIQPAGSNLGLLPARLTRLGRPRRLRWRALSSHCRLVARLMDRYGPLTCVRGPDWIPTAFIGPLAPFQAA